MSHNGDYKPRNFRIVRHVTKTTILVIEDCLRLDKLRVEIVSYQRGEGVRATAEHYLDADVARLLCTELATGHLAEPYQEFKGTVRDGQPQSRILKISEAKARNPIKIEITNGPGEVVGEGAIKPAGKPRACPERASGRVDSTRVHSRRRISLAVLLSRWDARRIALAVLAHLGAWATATYYQRVADNTWQPPRETVVNPETGEIIS